MVVCCHPSVDQDGIDLFRPGLRPGFQGDRPRPLLSPLLNEARTLACIPPNDRKRIEPDANQSVQLVNTAGGNNPDFGIGLHQGPEPINNILLTHRIKFIEAVDQKLGHPDIDPHGDPIPSPDGYVAPLASIPLTELPLNTAARISRLLASSPDLLQHVVDREFRLGDEVEVTTREAWVIVEAHVHEVGEHTVRPVDLVPPFLDPPGAATGTVERRLVSGHGVPSTSEAPVR